MRNQRFNVMQVIGNLQIGGAQEVVRTLVDYLAWSGCHPIVCTFMDGPMRQDIERSGTKVVVLPRRHRIVAFPFFVVDMIRIWRQLAGLIRENKIDVVQTHLFDLSTNSLMLLLPYTTDLRLLFWTVHNVDFGPAGSHVSRPKRIVYRSVYRLASRMANGFIAVSDKVKKAMVEEVDSIEDSITVICNGVDVKRYGHPLDKTKVLSELGLEAGAYSVAVVGTLKEQKGHRYLIEAMSSIVPQYPNCHLLVIGDGELREELQAQTERRQLGENIHFLGNRHDVTDLLAASDLFVLPSLWEGLPMALIEAMASGLPIVATQVSGTTQVMLSGETGILVPPGDTQTLTGAILEMLSNPERARAMGVAARRHVEEGFSAQRQADEHLDLYHRLWQQEAEACRAW